MKQKEQVTLEAYEAPKVEVIEVEVEKGFAVSPHDMPYGDNPFVTNP